MSGATCESGASGSGNWKARAALFRLNDEWRAERRRTRTHVPQPQRVRVKRRPQDEARASRR